MGCNISIFGGCISRDFFGLHDDDAGYNVTSLIQWCSPIAAVTKSAALKEITYNCPEMEVVFEGKPNFNKKMVVLDINKEAFKKLEKTKADYIFVEASAMRYDLLKYEIDGEVSFTTIVLQERIDALKEQGVLPEGGEIVSIMDMPDEEYEHYMGLFCDRILEIYDEEQIILLEFHGSPFSTNGERISTFNYEDVIRETYNIDRGNDFFRKRFSKAHLIEFPKGVISDDGNKWGRYCLHYIPEYYDYGLDAVRIITEGGFSKEKEKEELLKNKEQYETQIKAKYDPIFVKSIDYYRSRDNLSRRMTRYVDYFKTIILDKSILNNMIRFFVENGYSSCAFYGLNEIGKTLIELFRGWGITVDFAVENFNSKSYRGIPVIRRGADCFPKTQVMIVADVMNTQTVKDKLMARNLPFPVHDVYEIAGMAGSKQ